jgi:hypothetical protein
MFNDEITLYHHPSADQKRPVSLNRTGIAWDSDKNFKFKNPSGFGGASSEMWKKYVKPKGNFDIFIFY